MKTVEWKGPDIPAGCTPFWVDEPIFNKPSMRQESLSESMDRLHHEKHAKFRRWQDALTMNMIFGDSYVTVPEIPKGYEDYAKWWYDNELKSMR